MWPNSRYGVDFNALLRCLLATNASTVILPRLPYPLLVMQRMVFDIIHTHTFGLSKHPTTCHHSWYGRDWQSYLISALRQLFTDHAAASTLKMTTPTGTQVAVVNIHRAPQCSSAADQSQTIQFIQQDLK